MADRNFQDYANSGEITDIKTNGVTVDDSLMSANDIQARISLTHSTSSADVATQPLTVTPVKITTFTATPHDLGAAINADIATQRFTALKAGLFRIYGVISAEFANNNEVSVVLYKNGLILTPPVTLQGRGAGKGVLFSYVDIVDLSANDYLEIYAYADASVSFDITGSSIVIEKTFY